MSDALALPLRPNVEQFKKLAENFRQACQTADPAAVRSWAEILANLHCHADVPAPQREINLDVERIQRTWEQLRNSNQQVERGTLAGAQLLLARCHGFASWPEFTEHLQALALADSPVSQFEAAVDALVSGDIAVLRKSLPANPGLVHTRSTREHRSTLLHYVSANGVEDFRQKTPPNIVEIAKLLLDAGSAVNAESEAYGGRSTALGLTATSGHPAAAGVQLALMDLLIERGALVDGPGSASGVNACLQNGRGEAAEHLAHRGARLDLEGAAGLGRLDIVKAFFDDAGRLKPTATQQQLLAAFTWACEFDRIRVIEFLLGHGVPVNAKLKGGATGLHWAAYGGHAGTVQLLLERGAPLDLIEESYGGTPLGWALHAWGNRRQRERRQYHETVALLVRAGAKVDPPSAQMQSDPRMLAALRGEI